MAEQTPRAFARWRRGPDPGPGNAQIPEDGVCLSAFLLVTDPNDAHRVLVGHVDPAADWSRFGALGGDRLVRTAKRWMLPASHLLEYEGPSEAARRIATEQLERPDLPIPEPRVVSDAYARPDAPGRHWDFHFLYRTTWPAGAPLRARPWTGLEFVDPRAVPASEFARSHDDILRFAGLLPSA